LFIHINQRGSAVPVSSCFGLGLEGDVFGNIAVNWYQCKKLLSLKHSVRAT